jgi:hypothetical protein
MRPPHRVEKTKPISGVAAGRFIPRPSPLRPPAWWLYKQTQFRQAYSPAFQSLGTIMRNKPNLAGRPGPRRAQCAKQTQFGPAGQGGRRWDEVQMRKTNPISPAGPAEPPLGSILRNKPNLPPSAQGRAGEIVRNEANWPLAGVRRGRPTHEEPRGDRAKQSQFGHVARASPACVGAGFARGSESWAGRPCHYSGGQDIPLFRYPIIPPFQPEGDGAKQSQFRRLGRVAEGEMCKTNPCRHQRRCRAGTPNPFGYRSGQALRRAGGKIDRLRF